MKRILLLLLIAATATVSLFAQDAGTKKKKDWSKVNLSNRPKDHLVAQIGYLTWLQKPDSIATKGFTRSINGYFSFDFPVKVDPRFSVGLGVGIGTDHMVFDEGVGRNLNIINGTAFRFAKHSGRDTANRYKSMKLASVYAEAPVELRFMSNPENPNKSIKFAIGVKVGTLLTAIDKTKYEVDGNGNSAYTTKEKDKKHFNNFRLAPTARIGYGNFAIYAQYQLNDFIKEGQGPNQIRPFTVGLTLTGL
jgi:hypothetical protein